MADLFMKVAVASDHRGFELKKDLLSFLRKNGYSHEDLGTHDSKKAVDYTDYAERVGVQVARGVATRGILVCGSGVGACIAANKLPGVRASVCHDIFSAHQGVEHDDMNVLVLGAWIISDGLAQDLVERFLLAQFDNQLRHARRIKKIRELEIRYRNKGDFGNVYELNFADRSSVSPKKMAVLSKVKKVY